MFFDLLRDRKAAGLLVPDMYLMVKFGHVVEDWNYVITISLGFCDQC